MSVNLCQPTDKACQILIGTVIPLMGVVTAVATTVAPLKTVLYFRRLKVLGPVNPIPYAFIYVNALIWIFYGLFIKDVYVIAPNTVGILFGAFYTRTAYIFATGKQRMMLDAITLGLSFCIFIGSMIAYLAVNVATGRSLLGWIAIAILILFYSSPLSVFAQVIKSRNAIAFHTPLAIMCLANGGFWAIYGFVLNDPFVYAPNILGAAVAVVQLVFKVIFKSVSEDPGLSSEEEVLDKSNLAASHEVLQTDSNHSDSAKCPV